MLQAIPLKCASCGSNLQITSEMNTFACGYCGASQIVERYGGTISLRLVTDAIRQVQVGTDKTAAELALKRLGRELEVVQQNHSMAFMASKRRADSNSKTFAVVWIVGLLVCLSIGTVIGLLVGISTTVAVIYFWNKKDSLIKLNFSEQAHLLSEQGNRIQDKIAENRRFVDS